jgi:hypothetical protein
MLVRQEDVAQGGQGHVGEYKLPGYAVAAVDDIRSVIADNDLRGRRTRFPRSRPATRSE